MEVSEIEIIFLKSKENFDEIYQIKEKKRSSFYILIIITFIAINFENECDKYKLLINDDNTLDNEL